MALINCTRSGCKDVFNSFLVNSAEYSGLFEFPVVLPVQNRPNRLIPFSRAISLGDYDYWIHFYEDDYLFERLWKNPRKYLSILKRFNGVILPDFSLYRDMPLVMQLWNIYRSRALGTWLQQNQINVIPNVRFGDKRTFRYCCDGLSSGGVIAVGSYGTIKNRQDRDIFIAGLDVVIQRLSPTAIVVYGSAPSSIFKKYCDAGIEVLQFDSEFCTSRKEVQ